MPGTLSLTSSVRTGQFIVVALDGTQFTFLTVDGTRIYRHGRRRRVYRHRQDGRVYCRGRDRASIYRRDRRRRRFNVIGRTSQFILIAWRLSLASSAGRASLMSWPGL